MLNSPSILLVEDNPSDAELAMLTFTDEGYGNRTKIIRNGADALEFLMPTSKEEQLNNIKNLSLIFLDIMLPKLNGFEVLEQLDKSIYMSKIPVAIFSSSEVLSDVNRAYALGVNGYLVKPIDFNLHQKVLRSALNFWVNDNKKHK